MHQHRYTSLDRIINRDAKKVEDALSPFFMVVAINSGRARVGRSTSLVEQHTADRLKFLELMGLAELADANTWRVRRDFEFENILRAMQRSVDRQKMLATHGVLMSDERLPLAVLDFRRLTALEGRIFGAWGGGQGRHAGRSYFMLEGTDGQVHYVYYTPELEARTQPGRSANQFVCASPKVILRRASGDQHWRVGGFRVDFAQQGLSARNRATAYPARDGFTGGGLECMARSLPESPNRGCNASRTHRHPAKETGRDRRRDQLSRRQFNFVGSEVGTVRKFRELLPPPLFKRNDHEQVRLHGHGVVPDAAERNSEIDRPIFPQFPAVVILAS